MELTKFNEEVKDQICDLLENLKQTEKLRNKDILFS